MVRLAETMSTNSPALLVLVPCVSPFTETDTNSSGILFSSVTLPLSIALSFCAKRVKPVSSQSSKKPKYFMLQGNENTVKKVFPIT